MKKIEYSVKAKKDLKRYRHKPQELRALFTFLEILAREQPIPAKYKAHLLHGEYEDCMECHIKGDFLLVWIDESQSVVRILRIGSHSELFKKY